MLLECKFVRSLRTVAKDNLIFPFIERSNFLIFFSKAKPYQNATVQLNIEQCKDVLVGDNDTPRTSELFLNSHSLNDDSINFSFICVL